MNNRIKNIIQQQHKKKVKLPLDLVYISIPDAPAFGTTTTINPNAGTIETADLGGNTDIILGAGIHAPWVKILDIVGTEGTPVRFKGAGGTNGVRVTQLGDDTPGNAIALGLYATTDNGGEWVELYDLFIWGEGGFQARNQHGAFLMQNCDIEDDGTHFHAISCKTDNNNTLTAYPITIKYCRIVKHSGEGFYIGQTVGATFHNISLLTALHNYCYLNGREPFQVTHVEDMAVNHFTGRAGGQTDTDSQDRAIQIGDSNGLIQNSLFQTSAQTTNFAMMRCTGVTLKNCFFEGVGNLYLSNIGNQDWFANSTIKDNDDLIWDNCIFYSRDLDGETKLCEIYHDQGNVIIKNSVIVDGFEAGGLYGGNPTPPYEFIDGGGNVYLPASNAIFHPTFDSFGRITSAIHHRRGMGYLVSDPTYPSVTVTVTGDTDIDDVLTGALSNYSAGSGIGEMQTAIYQWFRADDVLGTNEAEISSATAITYTVTANDQGKYLRLGVRVRNTDYLVSDYNYSDYVTIPGAATTTIWINFHNLGTGVGGNWNDVDNSVFTAAPGTWIADLKEFSGGTATGIGLVGISQVANNLRNAYEGGEPYFSPHNVPQEAMENGIMNQDSGDTPSAYINYKLTGVPNKDIDIYFFASNNGGATYAQDVQATVTGGNVKSDSIADAYQNNTDVIECLACQRDGSNELNIELDTVTGAGNQYVSLCAMKIVYPN